MSGSSLLSVYKVATTIASYAMPVWLTRRVARGKEIQTRLPERYGEAATPRPNGPLIWCHAASVGETMSILLLIEALQSRSFSILLTTGTVTSQRLVQGRAMTGLIHQFAPLDHDSWVNRFLDHWRPDLALRVDSDIWPNTLSLLRQRKVPIIQINARMSDGAFKNWARFSRAAQAVFGTFDLVCAQSDIDQMHFVALGARNVHISGNLKLAQNPLPFDASALEKLKAQIGGRPVWIAASIHPGEDEIVGQAHRAIKATRPDVLTIVIPRHAERAESMIKHLRSAELITAQRSRDESISNATDIYMADTMGELGLFYRASSIAFIGKTFTVGGGQNPAEPALIGAALVWGPDMTNFAELAAHLEQAGAAIKVAQSSALGPTIAELLADPTQITRMSDAGQAYVMNNADGLTRTLAMLAPYLDRLAIR